jgi:hypothetical protein
MVSRRPHRFHLTRLGLRRFIPWQPYIDHRRHGRLTGCWCAASTLDVRSEVLRDQVGECLGDVISGRTMVPTPALGARAVLEVSAEQGITTGQPRSGYRDLSTFGHHHHPVRRGSPPSAPAPGAHDDGRRVRPRIGAEDGEFKGLPRVSHPHRLGDGVVECADVRAHATVMLMRRHAPIVLSLP